MSLGRRATGGRPGVRAWPARVVSLCLALPACGGASARAEASSREPSPCPWSAYPARPSPAVAGPADPSRPYFHAALGLAIGDPGAASLTNANGSPRVVRPGTARVDTAAYAEFQRTIAPLLERWGRDSRLAINPAFVAALLAKESGFHAGAVSPAAALGYAQLTATADSDLRIVARADSLSGWMCREVRSWPRDPRYHDRAADSAAVARLVASGALTARGEYLLDPRTAARAAVLWLRVLEATWTGDVWPGTYGTLAREKLNGGAPLTEEQLLELVTASYNYGYTDVAPLVERYGPRWKEHLPPETADYVQRIKAYTVLFQTAPRR